VPTKPVEVIVVDVVLPVIAPEVGMVNAAGADMLYEGGATVALTVVVAEVGVVAPAVVPVPVMFSVMLPLEPRVVVRVTFDVAVAPVPEAVSVTGVAVQVGVPGFVTLGLVAVQVKLTVPANRFCDLRVTVLVPEAEPAAIVIAAPPVAVKLGPALTVSETPGDVDVA
jgi:hypothetical protein